MNLICINCQKQNRDNRSSLNKDVLNYFNASSQNTFDLEAIVQKFSFLDHSEIIDLLKILEQEGIISIANHKIHLTA